MHCKIIRVSKKPGYLPLLASFLTDNKKLIKIKQPLFTANSWNLLNKKCTYLT